MGLLITGMVVWCAVHLFPAALPSSRNGLVERLGANAYRGLFALVILASLAAIVFGWKTAPQQAVYSPPLLGSPLPSGLVYIGIILFMAAQFPTNIKRFLRHPQLTGVIIWGIGHLLTNGEQRSVLLFGGLSLWALVQILLTNRRDGSWIKPAPAALKSDLITVTIGTAVFAAFFVLHPWLFGVAAVSR